MNISLNPNLEKFIHEKVDTGLYNSASEVIREGIRLMMEKDTLFQQKIRLNQDIEKGLEQLQKGQGLEGEKVFNDIRTKFSKSSFQK
jgi:antitoxin ParD1/3/4